MLKESYEIINVLCIERKLLNFSWELYQLRYSGQEMQDGLGCLFLITGQLRVLNTKERLALDFKLRSAFISVFSRMMAWASSFKPFEIKYSCFPLCFIGGKEEQKNINRKATRVVNLQ